MSETTPAITEPAASAPVMTGRTRLGYIVTLLGLLALILGAKPEWLRLDRSPVIGFVQTSVFLVGLAVICVGGYLALTALWGTGQRSIPADIGLRLVSTGYVVALFCGMADVFGMGSHPLPGVPFFGMWQARGVEIGEAIIAIGFLMVIPFRRQR